MNTEECNHMKNNDWTELQKMIEINSWTKNKEGVDAYGALIAQDFEALGFQVTTHQRQTIGDHLYFTSSLKEGKRMLLLGHLDTVFPPDTFEGFREDDIWIYGAGVCDMKGGNYVALSSLRQLKESFGEIYNIDMLLVSDEETGSDDSKHLLRQLASKYDYCMVFEAAGKNDEVVVARKGVGTFSLDITGKASHAGNHYKEGVDANLEVAHQTLALVGLTNLSLNTTVNVGKIEGGIGANTISPSAKMTFEIRYTSTKERDRLLQEIDTLSKTPHVEGITLKLSGGIQRDVMEETIAQKEWIETINTFAPKPLKSEARGGVSDANIIASQGVTTLDGWGPYGDGDHTVYERASKESFKQRIELVTACFEHFLKGDF